MAYCGGGGAGAGWRMVEADGKGLFMLAHIKTAKKSGLCVSYFVSVLKFLVRVTVITRTGYFAHTYSVQMPECTQNKEG